MLPRRTTIDSTEGVVSAKSTVGGCHDLWSDLKVLGMCPHEDSTQSRARLRSAMESRL